MTTSSWVLIIVLFNHRYVRLKGKVAFLFKGSFFYSLFIMSSWRDLCCCREELNLQPPRFLFAPLWRVIWYKFSFDYFKTAIRKFVVPERLKKFSRKILFFLNFWDRSDKFLLGQGLFARQRRVAEGNFAIIDAALPSNNIDSYGMTVTVFCPFLSHFKNSSLFMIWHFFYIKNTWWWHLRFIEYISCSQES